MHGILEDFRFAHTALAEELTGVDKLKQLSWRVAYYLPTQLFELTAQRPSFFSCWKVEDPSRPTSWTGFVRRVVNETFELVRDAEPQEKCTPETGASFCRQLLGSFPPAARCGRGLG